MIGRHESFSSSEQITHLGEGTFVIRSQVSGAQQPAPRHALDRARHAEAQSRVDILLVGVVPDVDGGPGVDEIGKEYVGIKIFDGLERTVGRIRKQPVVLPNEAQGPWRELVIPFGADDVIVEDCVLSRAVDHAVQDVGGCRSACYWSAVSSTFA